MCSLAPVNCGPARCLAAPDTLKKKMVAERRSNYAFFVWMCRENGRWESAESNAQCTGYDMGSDSPAFFDKEKESVVHCSKTLDFCF